MSIISSIAERSEQKRSVVKKVYAALIEVITHDLKKERRVRLPDLGIVGIKFRPARAKRKGINPFTKKETTFKARPASNKLKFRFAKGLRLFVEKLEVVEPKKKKKHHHKKHHS